MRFLAVTINKMNFVCRTKNLGVKIFSQHKKYWVERGAGASIVHPRIYGQGVLLQSPTIRDGMATRRVWDQE